MSQPDDTRVHLDELAYDRMRLDARASDPAFFEAAERHLAACDACRAAFAQLDAVDRDFTLPPSLAVAARARGGGRRRLWAVAGAALALAAGVVVAVRLAAAPVDDGLRVRGGALELQVYVHDGRESHLVIDASEVHAHDRVAFRARASATGWLLIVGWDDRLTPYPVHPSGDAGFAAAPFDAARDFVQLDAGLELDERPGSETLVAIHCPERFSLADLVDVTRVDVDGLGRAAADRGCALRSVRLDKR